jgi:hypothetical protein
MTATTKAPSIWLRLVAYYFKIGGVIFAVIAVLGLVSGFALDWAPGTTQAMPMPLAVAIVCAMAFALLAAGILLARRLRAGAVLGLVLTLYPVAFALVQRRTMTWLELALIVVPTIVLVSVWRELEWRHDSRDVSAPLTDQQ